MLSYLKRILTIIITFFGITLLIFCLMRMIPGDPIMIMLGEKGLSPETYALFKAKLGLDQPLYKQYFLYIKEVLTGNLGNSIRTQVPVWIDFWEHFKATLELSICAILFSILIGIPLGVFCALKKGSVLDKLTTAICVGSFSMPVFWLGILLIVLFSVELGVTPISGRYSDYMMLDDNAPLTGFMLIDTLLWGSFDDFKDSLLHLVLPTITLSSVILANILRITRSSMISALQQDYIRTARAKGLSKERIIMIHALRNALLPVMTTIGLQIGSLMAGALLTENTFAWPGVGSWLLQALQSRDYPVVQGGVLLVAILVILVNLLVDVLYNVVDPRVRVKR